MKHKEYNPELSYRIATRMGLVIAGLWTVSFLVVVLNFPSFLAELGYLVGLMPLIVMVRNLRGIRTLIMPMTWTQCLSLSILAFFGGTLILTLVQFLYFAYADHGHFMHAMLENLQDPMMVKYMKEAGNGEMLKQMTTMMKEVSEFTPRELTIQFFSTNLTFSVLFSLIASLLGRFGNKRINKDNVNSQQS